MTIHILDGVTVDKIAAGEVVERPASVIKELVENSIDAQADKIEVEITAGGTSFMRVTDNGTGMDMKNARLCVLRHATSKIQQVDDLMKINTLGFRGEALATIAAISQVELISVTEGNDAWKVECDGEFIGKVEPAALDRGTQITVRNIFFNTPVRRKFLKTDKKDLKLHIGIRWK